MIISSPVSVRFEPEFGLVGGAPQTAIFSDGKKEQRMLVLAHGGCMPRSPLAHVVAESDFGGTFEVSYNSETNIVVDVIDYSAASPDAKPEVLLGAA